MCWYEVQPEIKFWSSSDVTQPLIGLQCRKVIDPPSTISLTDWWRFWKLLERLHFPF